MAAALVHGFGSVCFGLAGDSMHEIPPMTSPEFLEAARSVRHADGERANRIAPGLDIKVRIGCDTCRATGNGKLMR